MSSMLLRRFLQDLRRLWIATERKGRNGRSGCIGTDAACSKLDRKGKDNCGHLVVDCVTASSLEILALRWIRASSGSSNEMARRNKERRPRRTGVSRNGSMIDAISAYLHTRMPSDACWRTDWLRTADRRLRIREFLRCVAPTRMIVIRSFRYERGMYGNSL
jgi:uncharacterized protein (DUF2235 family)